MDSHKLTPNRLLAGMTAVAAACVLVAAAAPGLGAAPAEAAICRTCGSDGGPDPTTTTTAPPNTPPTASFSWSRDRRASGAGASSDLAAVGNYLASPFQVYLNGCGSTAGSKPISSYSWTINGSSPVSGCSVTWPVNNNNVSLSVTLTVTDSVGLRSTQTQTVQVVDRWIVTMGDSIASGEGNPQQVAQHDWLGFISAGPVWPNRRCDRTTRSASQQAAVAYENSHPHESVTYVNLACSGAKIINVLPTSAGGLPYNGINLDGTAEAPQMDQLQTLHNRSGRTPDIVYLSAGANDFDFGGITKDCASLSSWTESSPNCAQLDSRVLTGDNLLVGTRGNYSSTPQNYGASRYGTLAKALTDAGIPSSRVEISQYPDPTKKDDGTLCDDILGDTPLAIGRIDRLDVAWASQPLTASGYAGPVTVLNMDVAYAAAQNGWKLTPGIATDFNTHGYCANGKWDNTYSDSNWNQGDMNGMLHPNAAGTSDYAGRIRQGLVEAGLLPA